MRDVKSLSVLLSYFLSLLFLVVFVSCALAVFDNCTIFTLAFFFARQKQRRFVILGSVSS